MNAFSAEARRRLKAVKLLILDVDGVLTDGSIIYGEDGSETKIFNVKDGLGIRLLMESGIQVGIITGRRSNALYHRCRDLGIVHVIDGAADKSAAFEELNRKTGVAPEETACICDDLPDLPLMRKAGISICVADAHETLRRQADIVTSTRGGGGAVREVCEAILKAGDLWDSILGRL
jgi:3-deoxy-D-manno-octulosonate 8-phosphate phosphatase (KDO 8-P phosphatase)